MTVVFTMDQWIAFAESGNQQRLNDANGKPLQGWVMEISDDALLFSHGDGERGVEQWLPLSEIDPQSLAYFDSQTRCWVDFCPAS